MARGGFRPGAGRPRSKPVTKQKKAAKTASTAKVETVSNPVKSHEGMMPLDYMLAVMRDENAGEERRDRMAQAAASFIHPRAGVKRGGKKEEKLEAAKTANNVFSLSRGKPKLVVDNK